MKKTKTVQNKEVNPQHVSPERLPLTDPTTGLPLAPRKQPGYYAGFSTMAQYKYWDAATRSVIAERMGPPKPIRFFNEEEALTLAAVMDRILPQEDRTEDRKIELLPVLDDRLFHHKIDGYRYEDMPSDRDAYRLGAKAFAAMAHELYGKPFHTLTVTEQEQILQSVHHAEPTAAEELWQQMNIERFWTMLVGDCCSAYYQHPWAWDEIGFGGPSYPRGYMRLEEGEPEPWEKGEQRYGWRAPADTLSAEIKAHGKGKEHQTHPGQGGTH
jgi:hypothetical protein